MILIVLNSCRDGISKDTPDRYDQGTIHISADESFKNVIDSQVEVYESSYPETKIVVHYKPEAECLRDFAVDSIKMIIATRGFSEDEKIFLKDSMKVTPSMNVIAYDAIAVIVNKESPDSLFTMEELKQVLQGGFNKNLIPVFDGLNATSTIRFIIDSILKGAALTSEAEAARNSEEVIDYIARTPNAVGFIGVNWIGNKEDTTQMSFLTKVTLASLESTDKPGAFVKPVQANIYTRRYPMVRDLVYTLKEKHTGLAHGFANFLRGERGQLIFKRAYLVPAQLQFINIRNASFREE
jgi:phosphate transport system substrate-binding protein